VPGLKSSFRTERYRTHTIGKVEAPSFSATICNMSMLAPPPRHLQPRKEASPAASERPFWARVKLWVGGVGLVPCGLLWLFEATFFFLPDPMDPMEGAHLNSNLTMLAVLLLSTVFFLVIVRSGLRGPADPLAPNERPSTIPGPIVLPFAPAERQSDEPQSDEPTPSQHKKPHLRLVRPAR